MDSVAGDDDMSIDSRCGDDSSIFDPTTPTEEDEFVAAAILVDKNAAKSPVCGDCHGVCYDDDGDTCRNYNGSGLDPR